ncbi:protein kinase domain-containing protein [Actinomyces marmotae]|uniref:protein kinase domain-containing protein n=1 Tax=Actinomyces marmotae TaxID=2737173 RepID=UPI001357A5CE|nr:serine/threonine-protein kinase [Actinomyces marmotae]
MTQPPVSLPPSISGLRAGATVGGYRLLRRLGAGGMGAVWEVTDEAGDRVAMKILHPQIAADPMARRRLDREAQVLARVRDARVARILDIETGDSESAHGMTFVITELVEGPTLQREVDREGAYDLVTDVRDLSDLAHGLVDALRAVHDAGVIHRDLKPSNVMLGAQGPVLIDFGIAQVADDVRLTQTGQVTGTPGFIPPEMLDGDEPSPGVDWYACAGVLLFAVTGRAPFGSGPWQVVFRRVYAGTPELGDLPEECPALARAFRAALEPKVADRLSIDGLLSVLDEIADGGDGSRALAAVLPGVGGAAPLPSSGASDGAYGVPPASGPSLTSVQRPGGSPTMTPAASGYGAAPGAYGRVPAPSPFEGAAPDARAGGTALPASYAPGSGGAGPGGASPMSRPASPPALPTPPSGGPVSPAGGPTPGWAPAQAAQPMPPAISPQAQGAGAPGTPGPAASGWATGPTDTGPTGVGTASAGALDPASHEARPASAGTSGVADAPAAALPDWAREPQRRRTMILCVGFLLVMLGMWAPVWVALAASILVVIAGAAGRGDDDRRWRRLHKGSATAADTARMWATSPLYLLRSAGAALPAILLAGVVAGGLYFLLRDPMGAEVGVDPSFLEDMRLRHRRALLMAGCELVFLLIVWFVPWGASTRRGGAKIVSAFMPGRPIRALWAVVLVSLGVGCLVLEVLMRLPPATLSPLQ